MRYSPPSSKKRKKQKKDQSESFTPSRSLTRSEGNGNDILMMACK